MFYGVINISNISLLAKTYVDWRGGDLSLLAGLALSSNG